MRRRNKVGKIMIKAEKVTFAYPAQDNEEPREVLHGIDLEIKQGEFVALLGHNGCGKSTLAKHFNALLLPTGGRVLVEEMDTDEISALLHITPSSVRCQLSRAKQQLIKWYRK